MTLFQVVSGTIKIRQYPILRALQTVYSLKKRQKHLHSSAKEVTPIELEKTESRFLFSYLLDADTYNIGNYFLTRTYFTSFSLLIDDEQCHQLFNLALLQGKINPV